jgi:hypothetical protein
MTTFDFVFPALLVLSVLRQVRGRQLTWFQLCWPIALVLWAATEYLRGFPATAADVGLVGGCAAAGAALGTFAGLYTRVHRRPDGTLMAYATAATVVLWTLGTIGRLVFGLYAEHGGGAAIAAFDAAHGLTFGAWSAALILMALTEVLGRTAALTARVLRVGD